MSPSPLAPPSGAESNSLVSQMTPLRRVASPAIGAKVGLINNGCNPARNDQPVMVYMEWDYRLNVQYILSPTILADWKIHIVLKRHTDEVGHRVLKRREQFSIVGTSLGGKQACGGERNRASSASYIAGMMFGGDAI